VGSRWHRLAAVRAGGHPLNLGLRDLAGKGIETVPTFWREGLEPGELLTLFEELRSLAGVIKPIVSGTAQGAWRLDADSVRTLAPEVEAFFAGRPLMMQPFEQGIVEEGEFSLMYFNGVFSHGIQKVPKSGDFRVQGSTAARSSRSCRSPPFSPPAMPQSRRSGRCCCMRVPTS